MSLTPFTVEKFGGLNLRDDPFEFGVNGAETARDVAFDVPGRVRTRDGYETYATTATAPQRLHLLTDFDNNNFHIVSSSSTELEVFKQGDGSAVASGTVTPNLGPYAMTTYGAPGTGTVVYATHQLDGSVNSVGIRKWSGSAWSAVSGTNCGRGIAFTRASNRLVVGGTNGGSRVEFSDAGAPETFTSTNFVDLTPHDGEYITQVVAWQDYVFVFKLTKFFVFYGESTDSTGDPIFNYRAVSGVGSIEGIDAAAAAPHGVYFLAEDGLYLTTGGLAQKVDGVLEPLFTSGPQGLVLGPLCHITWHGDRLIVVLQISTGGDPRVYVYYPRDEAWAQWMMMAGKVGGGFGGGLVGAGILKRSLLFVNGTDSAIYRMGPDLTDDDGTAIPWSYLSGRYPLADPGRVTVIRESSVTGHSTNGAITLDVYTDKDTSGGTSTTIGEVESAPEEGYVERDKEGKLFQHGLSGNHPATVHRVTHYVSFVKPAGIE